MLRSVLQHGTPLTALARPRLLVSSSEVLDPGLRRQVLAHWTGEIFDFYGTMEVGRIAAECPAHAGLHVEADAVVVELLDGDHPAAPGVPGRVVVTALDQYAAPFIRYDLGDLCAAAAGPCACGWPTPLIGAPLGRSADVVMTPAGWLSAARLYFALRAEADVLQHRFVQDTPDRIAAQIVFERPPTPGRLADLRRRLEETLSGLPVEIHVLDAIPRGGDKFRGVVSRLRPGEPGPS
jgi:phenylacetate-CoA ligase